MPRSSLFVASTTLGAFLLATDILTAQSTTPFWSSRFGGSGRDEIVAIRRGPGDLITLVGHTTSIDLPGTAGHLQAANAGGNDVFVARLDPAARTLLWCTYLGGSALELAFDAAVDPSTGATTVVGLSLSTDFPSPSGPSPTRNGPSDGFLAQIDTHGNQLLSSMFVGGPAHDRLCEVELDAAGQAFVAGVTEAPLPAAWTAGTVFPTFRGGLTDAFLARIDPAASQVVWATHIGGGNTEGMPFASWPGLGNAWEGDLDRMALTLGPAGQAVLATASFVAASPAPTLGTAMQTTHAGASDVYLAIVNNSGAAPLAYGTFHGGSLDERPRAIVAHPLGGFVVAGTTASTNLPTTTNCLQNALQGGPLGAPTDGFVVWIDPSQAGIAARRYATYLGGNGGEDIAMALATESSGHITVAGMSAGGNFPTTARCLQNATAANQWTGFVTRLQLAGTGTGDLLYSTFLDGIATTAFPETLIQSVVLDDVGDAHVAGASTSGVYPQVNPLTVPAGGREGVFTHLPLRAGCIVRDGFPFASPACGAPLYTDAAVAPLPGTAFAITATNAPPNMPGILVLGFPLPPTPLPPPLSGTLLTTLEVLPLEFADTAGFARHVLAVPAAAPTVPCWGLAAQWFFFTSPACPGSGMLANSERLNF